MTINVPVSLVSWKTSLAGVISFVVGLLQIYFNVSDGKPFKTVISNPVTLVALLSGVGLMLAKDSNVTGGTKGTPSTPQALADANQAPAVGVNAPVPASK
jgi:hypothetical protein